MRQGATQRSRRLSTLYKRMVKVRVAMVLGANVTEHDGHSSKNSAFPLSAVDSVQTACATPLRQ